MRRGRWRYSASGEFLWHDAFCAEGLDEVLGVAAGAAGVYVVGRTHGQLSWEGEVGATVPAGVNAFAKAYDSTGAEGWTLEFGTDG